LGRAAATICCGRPLALKMGPSARTRTLPAGPRLLPPPQPVPLTAEPCRAAPAHHAAASFFPHCFFRLRFRPRLLPFPGARLPWKARRIYKCRGSRQPHGVPLHL
jgi:hypothetical protein